MGASPLEPIVFPTSSLFDLALCAVAAPPAIRVRRMVRSTPGGRNPKGFTLVEVAIVLGIVGFLLIIALPSYAAWMADTEIANTAHHLADSMSLARSEAIKHGGRVNLCKSDGRAQCSTTGGWENGWLVYRDDEGTGQPNAEAAVVRVEPRARPGVTARANQPLANYVSYTALGHARLQTGALQMGTFTVCKSGRRGYNVVLANAGRVRVERAAALCP